MNLTHLSESYYEATNGWQTAILLPNSELTNNYLVNRTTVEQSILGSTNATLKQYLTQNPYI